MAELDFTGDPTVDQQIQQMLMSTIAQQYAKQRRILAESLASRGFVDSGLAVEPLAELGTAEAGEAGRTALAAAVARADRIRRQQEARAELERQKDLMTFQHRLTRKAKMSPWQRALIGGLSGAGAGAAAGSLAGPGYGTAIGAGLGAIGGGIIGYTSNEE